MNPQDDRAWHLLLQQSKPSFAKSPELPYGMMTRTLAQLRAQQSQQVVVESMCLRALYASFCALVVVGVVTLTLQVQDSGDLDPGVRSMAQVENVTVS